MKTTTDFLKIEFGNHMEFITVSFFFFFFVIYNWSSNVMHYKLRTRLARWYNDNRIIERGATFQLVCDDNKGVIFNG